MCGVVNTQIRGRKCFRILDSNFVRIVTLTGTEVHVHYTRVVWYNKKHDWYAKLRKPLKGKK